MRSELAMLRMLNRLIAACGVRTASRFVGTSIRKDQRGVSALEFSLFAPLVIFGFLSVADLAFLAQQYMAISHALRAGAQEAMLDKTTDPGAPEVKKVLNAMAADNFAVGSTTAVNGKPPLTFSASRYCVCPDSLSTPKVCLSVCTAPSGTSQPLAFYDISAESRSHNVFLPQVTLRPRLKVQVR